MILRKPCDKKGDISLYAKATKSASSMQRTRKVPKIARSPFPRQDSGSRCRGRGAFREGFSDMEIGSHTLCQSPVSQARSWNLTSRLRILGFRHHLGRCKRRGPPNELAGSCTLKARPVRVIPETKAGHFFSAAGDGALRHVALASERGLPEAHQARAAGAPPMSSPTPKSPDGG